MKKLEVRLVQQPGQERVVGWLAEAGPRPASRKIYFEYDPAFLRDPLWLSPFKLPPQPGLIEHRDHELGPIFGLFDDSLPDGWGLLLMDRFFAQQGLVPGEVSVLDRLAYLGTRTMGALTYHPPAYPSDAADVQSLRLDLHAMARASQEVIQGTAKEVLPQPELRLSQAPGCDAHPDQKSSRCFGMLPPDDLQRLGPQPGRPCEELRLPHDRRRKLGAGARL
jgi:serine/threonine-protein kinase HipA